MARGSDDNPPQLTKRSSGRLRSLAYCGSRSVRLRCDYLLATLSDPECPGPILAQGKKQKDSLVTLSVLGNYGATICHCAGRRAPSGYFLGVARCWANELHWLTWSNLPWLEKRCGIGTHMYVLLPREVIFILRMGYRAIAIRANGIKRPILIVPVHKTFVWNIRHSIGPKMIFLHRTARS
jgi:hypothetical protein